MKKIIPIEDGDFYWTPEGYRCFTAQYLLKREYCCESGCRHLTRKPRIVNVKIITAD